jgi:hypothetical protein
LLWLIASSAWADGVSKVKHYTDPENLWVEKYFCECVNMNKQSAPSTCEQAKCSVSNGGNYATLNVSIVRTVYLFYIYILQVV